MVRAVRYYDVQEAEIRRMTTPRHFAWFMALGTFWGVSPSVYKHLAVIGMPESHTIVLTGFGVGLVMLAVALWRSGWRGFDRRLICYGAICAFLMNLPFAYNLWLAARVPPTELAIIITLSPLFNYLMAWMMGSEDTSPRRLTAIGFGFLSTLVLIISRGDSGFGAASWWLVAAIGVPLLYTFYNSYAAHNWPEGADVIQAGAAESLWSGLWMLPVLLVLNPPGAEGNPALWHYWIMAALTAMWVVERMAYFTLINEKGAVYTVQATYVSTPAAVLVAAVFFGGASDQWLWVSLALLMVALYLNNTGRVTRAATQPSV
jgi:drug/metabolite transporter (DMT)-like permease